MAQVPIVYPKKPRFEQLSRAVIMTDALSADHSTARKQRRDPIINKPNPMDKSAIRVLLDTTFAPWIRDLGLAPESSTDTSVTLRLPQADKLRHVGGVICGQVFMAAADTTMIVAIAHALGGFQPMTTVSLTTSFLRPVKTGDVLVTASILRRGRNLVFGEIELHDETGALAAHATTTVMLVT